MSRPKVEFAPEPMLNVAPAAAEEPVRRPRSNLLSRTRRQKPEQPKRGGVERDGWVAVGVGFGLAVVGLNVPLFASVLYTLRTIIHESGRTATAWLLASPAVPQFDLTYGGGYSRVTARQPILVIVADLALLYCLFRARGDRRAVTLWVVVAVMYTVLMTTPLGDLLHVTMSHGAELLLASVFFYRALSGCEILVPIERPLSVKHPVWMQGLPSPLRGSVVVRPP